MKGNRTWQEDGGSNLGIALFCFSRGEVFLVLSILGHRLLLLGPPSLLLLGISFLLREGRSVV